MTEPPAVESPIRVDAVALRLFEHTVDHFQTQGWSLPERRYVSAGAQHEMAVDDEHFLVSLVSMDPGPANSSSEPGDLPASGAAMMVPPRAHLMLRLMRCVPALDEQGRAPSAAELHEAGVRLLKDPGRMLSALTSWMAAERILTVTWGQVEPQGPEAGISGHLASITVSPIQ